MPEEARRAWGIKLGSGGSAVEFCESRGIVGVGWKDVDLSLVKRASIDEVRAHLRDIYGDYFKSVWPGTLWKFVRECNRDDLILYYVPQRKSFVITRVATDDCDYRDTDVDDETDIWIYREVELLKEIPAVSFYAPLRGRLLGPRMSFWELRGAAEEAAVLARGGNPLHERAQDPQILRAMSDLRELVEVRLHDLNDANYEVLVADYFRAQGARVSGRVGGTQAVIDVRAVFDHGDLGQDEWLVQVKRYQDRMIGAGELQQFLDTAGTDGRLCYVSAFGFTEDARRFAFDNEIRLLETSDFVPFVLAGRASDSLNEKLAIPGWNDLGALQAEGAGVE